MTKTELIAEVSRVTESTFQEAGTVVEAILDAVVKALRSGERVVELRGFGSFSTRERPPRQGRNPKSGEIVDVPRKTIAVFKPSKALRDSLRPSSK